MKPVLLVHPALGGFEARLRETYEVVHRDDAAGRAGDITAALTIGSEGLDNSMISALPKLRLIACMGAGYDGVDVGFAAARGVAVTNCPNVNHEDVADLAWGLMLSAARHVAEGDRLVRSGQWRGSLGWPRRFSGRKLGVVGLGAIGRAVAERGVGFKLDIAWHGPRAKPGAPWRYEPDLIALAGWADILVVACPASAETNGLITADVIAALGPEGILVNIARGAVVDEDALIAALKDGRLGAAGLDVFAEEPTPAAGWADVPNVTLTPHIGGGAREAIRDATALALENLRRFFAGEALKTPVIAARA
jgi:lactate dehydrogenase-like 2-hydroxyacid dehydrogenase